MRLIPVRLWCLTVLAGILQILPFPIAGPVPLWRTAFCWIALLPLLMALLGSDKSGQPLTLRQTATLGYLCGFVWYLGNCYWIYQTMYLYGGLAKAVAAGILVLFCLYLGLYHALFGVLIGAFRRSRFSVQGALLLAPFAWVAVELARARITGLPWDLLGITQVDNPFLTRLAPVTGAYGLSFVIAAVNALWLVRIRLRERKYTRLVLTLAGVVIILIYVVAVRRLEPPTKIQTTYTATLVQHNLGVGTQTDTQVTNSQLLKSFALLSLYPPLDNCDGIPELPSTRCIHVIEEPGARQSSTPTDLIVWPESPSNFEERDGFFRNAMATIAHAAQAPIIVGDLGVDPNARIKRGYDLFNSANLVTPNGSFVGRYDKIHLVPFGEYVPFKKLFFFAGDLLGEVGSFDAGTHRTGLSTGGHNYGIFICYESIFGDEVRHLSAQGADVLVNISNDGWYGDTSAPWQHLNMVRMRAIENHRWVLRSTNTGVTAAIDPYGRVTAAAPRHIRTALHTGFNFEHDVTFYSAHGDLFAYACALVTMFGFGFSLQRKMK